MSGQAIDWPSAAVIIAMFALFAVIIWRLSK